MREILIEKNQAGQRFDKYLKKLTTAVGEENIEDVFETIFDFVESSGINNYEDIKVFDFARLIKAIHSLKKT